MNGKVYVQEVVVSWTKASRGAPLSAKRNALPEALAIAADELRQLQDGDCFSRVIMHEQRDFQVEQTVQPFWQQNGHEWPSLSIKFLNKGVVVARYKHTRGFGAPDRSDRPAVSYELEPDNLLRIQFNDRDSFPCGEWRYSQTTFNVLLTATASETMFEAKPAKCISDLADLW